MEALDNDYRIIADEFINVDKKVKFKHLGCGFEYETTPSLFFEGCRCPKCFGNNSKTTEEYKEVVRELSDGEYVVLGEYKNSQTNVDILHKKCGNILTTISPNGFIHAGIRCRFCGNKSKGEEEIKRVLDKYNILYEREKTFSGLKYKRNLYYDFYIESLNTCIEFNGMQHYKPSTTFGGEKQFERQIVRDAIKNAYCEDHNIGLIIIPFWDIRNVENILKQKFNLKECI